MLGEKIRAATATTADEGWDLAFATYNGANRKFFSVAAQEATPQGVFFKPDGTKMYVIGQTGDNVYEYNLNIAWDLSTAVFLQLFSIAAQEITPTGLFFKPDGTKMYVIGTTGDDVNEYNLSTAWDISTAVFLQLFSVAAQETTPQDLFFSDDGLRMYIIGTTNDTVYEYNVTTAWNISTAILFSPQFSIEAQELNPRGLFFKPDGTKMYVIGLAGDDVNEYDLRVPWSVSTAVFVQAFSVSAQDTAPTGLFFKPDGTKMYVMGSAGDDVNEYDLSTAWDISTAVFLQLFSVAAQDTAPQDLFFKPDGTKMYIIGATGDDVNEYNLSVPWDISTAVFLQLFSVSAQEITPTGLFFKPDGTKMYVIGETGDDVNEYNLSVPWDISTAVFLQLFSVAAQEVAPQGMFFRDDGLKMYIVGQTTGTNVTEYNITTAWNISTTVLASSQFSVAAQEVNPTGIFFKPDGTKMYVIGQTGDDVNEYNLRVPWSVSTAVFLQLKLISAQDTTPQGLFFRDDGLKMYIMGQDSDNVYEYNLSTAWDVTTAIYTYPTTDYYSVSTQETSPTDLFFKPDGTKMYVIGTIGDDVNEYDLSTAWDISTAVFLQLFSVAAQENLPQGVFFKPDGTKMYIIGSTGDDVNEYNLSVPWDISTAVFLQLFSVNAQEITPTGVFFKPDGTKMYVIGQTGDDVNEYNLSVAWDVSTASFLQLFSVAAQEATPQGVFFKPDGTKMYVIGQTGDDVNEYNLSTAWDISTAVFLQLFSVASVEIDPTGLFFKYDGLKMYIIGQSSNAIWSYDL
jgi:DNA-binding beta-propeller fold protein YncE